MKCKHLPSQKKRNQSGDFIGMQYSFLFWSAFSTLPVHLIFVVSYNTGWYHSHFLLCHLSFSVEQYRYLFNKFDYTCELRAIKSIKPSFLELPYSSYYSLRYFPHQHYDTVLFDYKSPLAHQLKFKTFLNIAIPDHVQLQ